MPNLQGRIGTGAAPSALDLLNKIAASNAQMADQAARDSAAARGFGLTDKPAAPSGGR